MDRQHAGSDPPLTVHSSVRGLLAATVTPLLLLVLGVGAQATAGRPAVLPLSLVALGILLGVGVLVDYPRRTRFDATGVTRMCPLRAHRLPWGSVVAIERTPSGASARLRRNLTERRGGTLVRGGLVARGPGRRRYLLTDRVEGAVEHDRLRELVAELGVATTLRARRPADDTPPTTLYRRRG